MKKTIVLFGASFLMLAELLAVQAAQVNVTESWTNASKANWTAYDLINEVAVWRASSFTLSNHYLKVWLPAQTGMPYPPCDYLVKADTNASGGCFTGDYLAGGVQAVNFRFFCDSPVTLWLAFASSVSNRWWQYSLGVQETGVWKSVSVPIHPDFFADLRGSKEWDALRQDLQQVAWIGLVIRQSDSLAAQTILLDDFFLSGPGADFASWMAQFNAQGSLLGGRVPLPSGDSDGDGTLNADEWLAGTSPVDSNDCLRLDIRPDGQGRPRINWFGHAGRVYSIWKCNDLRSGFSRMGSDMTSASDGAVSVSDSATNGAVFYRVKVGPSP